MIESYFTKFNTMEEYNDFKNTCDYILPNVSWIVNENTIISEEWELELPVNTIVLHKDGVFKEVSYDDFDEHYGDIVSSGYTVEGIKVIPSTHTTDGTIKIMSLVNMSTATPETGSSVLYDDGAYVYFGAYDVNLTGLRDFNAVAKVTNTTGETTISSNRYGSIPSDALNSGRQCVSDEKTKYSSSAASYCPSPYLTCDKPNPLYTMTTATNGLSDMDGSANTEAIIVYATAQPNWRTDSTITNTSTTGYYPAACCCKRYGTAGIPSGNWYLPSLGELGYVATRAGTINSLLTLIATKNPNIGALTLSGYYWSSTEFDTSGVHEIGFDDFNTNPITKNTLSKARAFASVHATPLNF